MKSQDITRSLFLLSLILLLFVVCPDIVTLLSVQLRRMLAEILISVVGRVGFEDKKVGGNIVSFWAGTVYLCSVYCVLNDIVSVYWSSGCGSVYLLIFSW